MRQSMTRKSGRRSTHFSPQSAGWPATTVSMPPLTITPVSASALSRIVFCHDTTAARKWGNQQVLAVIAKSITEELNSAATDCR